MGRCAYGGPLDLIAGDELTVKEMEVEECASHAAVQTETLSS